MTQTRRTKSREKILAAGERLFLEHAYLGTSMDAVTEAAGVSKQTVYAHFASKEALFLSVVAHMVGSSTDTHSDMVKTPSPDTPLPEYLRAYARENLRIAMTPRLMQIRRLVIGELPRFPELAESLWTHGPAASIAMLTEALVLYQASGEVKAGDPARLAAQFNWLVMGGPTSEAMLLGDAALPSLEEQERHADECTQIFLAAIATRD